MPEPREGQPRGEGQACGLPQLAPPSLSSDYTTQPWALPAGHISPQAWLQVLTLLQRLQEGAEVRS